MESALLKTDRISKSYIDLVGYRINLLQDFSVAVHEKEFVTFLAPAGSGKTSLLKILAGLEMPSDGDVICSQKKRVFIPSKPSSFPWLSVFENISFNSELEETEIQKIIDLVGLHGYEDHIPHNKSEGFRFRISLGRALANKPDILFLDEPFNNLNTATREEIYQLLRRVYLSNSIPFVFGTTNISEAIFLSERIYLMKKNPGEIISELKNRLPSDRNIDIMQDQTFFDLRSEIEQIFQQKAGRQIYNFSI